MPPIFDGIFVSSVLGTDSGRVILFLAGIACAGKAAMSKESEMTAKQKQEVIKEFNLKKGILVATFSGVMSACFSYGLRAGDPIKAIALQHGATTLWQGLPVLVPVLLGGFTTNFLWCLGLNIKNRTVKEYFHSGPRDNPVPMRPRRRHLVLPVPLLQHGRNPDGEI